MERLHTNQGEEKKEDANGLRIVGVGVKHMLHFPHHLASITICHDLMETCKNVNPKNPER